MFHITHLPVLIEAIKQGCRSDLSTLIEAICRDWTSIFEEKWHNLLQCISEVMSLYSPRSSIESLHPKTFLMIDWFNISTTKASQTIFQPTFHVPGLRHNVTSFQNWLMSPQPRTTKVMPMRLTHWPLR